jgi:hypothetical protein
MAAKGLARQADVRQTAMYTHDRKDSAAPCQTRRVAEWGRAHFASTTGAIRRRSIRPISPKHLVAARLWRSTRSAPFRAQPVLSAVSAKAPLPACNGEPLYGLVDPHHVAPARIGTPVRRSKIVA